ncbi:MAG: PhzF family phenazine biosynthesis isomerase [Firmicutes bacterium]|nr:PhzF family phenazine biosynthesis isomerase [Bacillota bacterium]
MREIQLFFTDSFTERQFRGNQAPIVLDAELLKEDEKQTIARELNASETIFISQSKIADFKIQFFTPKMEVELCGHGTIAAYWVLSSIGRISGSSGMVQIRQETKVGVLPVDIHFDGKKPDLVMMSQTKPQFIGEPFSKETIAKVLKMDPQDILDDFPIQNVSTGRAKLLIPIRNREKLYGLKPDFNEIKVFCQKIGTNGFHLFTFDTHEEISITTARHFAPTAGVNEDPVTGNASGALGCYLVKYCQSKINQSNPYCFIMEQGYNLYRDGKVFVEIKKDDEEISSVKAGGKATILFETRIRIN